LKYSVNLDLSGEAIRQGIDIIRQFIGARLLRGSSISDLHSGRLIGTGGTIKSIGTILLGEPYDNEKAVNGLSLQKHQIDGIFSSVCKLGMKEKMNITWLNPKRADVIVSGLVILRTIMEEYGFKCITISSQGVLEGLIGEYIRLA
jgi:exopolyphosphatase / guanosine-5'-triphosphate,3'-diphosphate pyrophosphatase